MYSIVTAEAIFMLLCHLVQNVVCLKVVARNEINYEKGFLKCFYHLQFETYLGSLTYKLKNVYIENFQKEQSTHTVRSKQ